MTLTMHSISKNNQPNQYKVKPQKKHKYDVRRQHLVSKIVDILLNDYSHIDPEDLLIFLKKIEKKDYRN